MTQHKQPQSGRHSAGQDPAKRQKILDGAQRVFLRMGFDAASMNDITREAGVSKSTIYVYFEGKDELFEALCEQHRSQIFAQISTLHDAPVSCRDSLISFGTALVTLVTSDIVISAQRTILGVTERRPDMGVRFYERGPLRGLTVLQNYIEKLEAEGAVIVPDIEQAANQLAELFLAGIYRPRLFAYMAAAPSEKQIRKNIVSAVDMFFAAYGATQQNK